MTPRRYDEWVPPRAHPAYLALFVFVVAPVGAAVIVSVLLLFGVPPHVVFAPGLALKAKLHAPNAIGVLTTVGIVWLVIVAAGLMWERARKRRLVTP